MKAYELLKNSNLEPEAKRGTMVYECLGPDYGTAAQDTRLTGTPHISVTLSPKGEYPFFTVPASDLREVTAH